MRADWVDGVWIGLWELASFGKGERERVDSSSGRRVYFGGSRYGKGILCNKAPLPGNEKKWNVTNKEKIPVSIPW